MKNVFHPMGLASFAGPGEDVFVQSLASNDVGSYGLSDVLNQGFGDLASGDVLQMVRSTGEYSRVQVQAPDGSLLNVPVTPAIFDAITGGIYAPAGEASMKWTWIAAAGVAAWFFFLRKRR